MKGDERGSTLPKTNELPLRMLVFLHRSLQTSRGPQFSGAMLVSGRVNSLVVSIHFCLNPYNGFFSTLLR